MATQKFNFNVPVKGINGDFIEQPKVDKRGEAVSEEFTNEKGELAKRIVWENVNLRKVLAEAVGNRYESDKGIEAKDLIARGKLARKLINSNTAKYTLEELNIIESCIAKVCGAIIASAYDEIVNPDDYIEQEPDEEQTDDKKKSVKKVA